ncbi:AAA family ATPase [Janthinobacterium sp. YR213]|uniref:KGGVGR-motif variant AAA ATPase n=1 Tax=Janthinobacterium sp. YR213 TaxID=1881027 RepID=UPI0008818FA7|nr:AAA family ATPase [Janthinobacterium sp. YR213]SDH21660.1 CobQ/CobB/MinD/ParA nucleotide binding domain-containing protein [Janthinobacterium sp. YR213]
MTIRFDESLPAFVKVMAESFNMAIVEKSVFVRDAGGKLSVIIDEDIDESIIGIFAKYYSDVLGPYARPDRVIAGKNAPGAKRLLKEAKDVNPIFVSGCLVRVLDRRIVGMDWLRTPQVSKSKTPRLVFASLKGGVGRSTALCVVAAYLSRRGRRVLAIDFDLEAPGIGTMLLNEKELPRFGTLDYFVESGISGIDNEFIADISGESYLGARGGRVTVVPAIGKETLANPENALGKIARAYIDSSDEDGTPNGLTEKLISLVTRFEDTGAYDIVLIDARAGLHETTAAAILGLGGDVLLFGTDQPQTFIGYKLLMAHLARFPIDLENDWRSNLRFVHAKSSDSPENQKYAAERFESLFSVVDDSVNEKKKHSDREYLDPSDEMYYTNNEVELTEFDFETEWLQDESDVDRESSFSAPSTLHVLDDGRYRDFDPLSDKKLLASSTFYASFGELIEYVDEIMDDLIAENHD